MSHQGLKSMAILILVSILFWVAIISISYYWGSVRCDDPTPIPTAYAEDQETVISAMDAYKEPLIFFAGDCVLQVPWDIDSLPKVGSVWIVMGTESVRYLEEVRP